MSAKAKTKCGDLHVQRIFVSELAGSSLFFGPAVPMMQGLHSCIGVRSCLQYRWYVSGLWAGKLSFDNPGNAAESEMLWGQTLLSKEPFIEHLTEPHRLNPKPTTLLLLA